MIQKIDNYLIERENDGDREAQVLYLLSAAKEALKQIREEGEGEKTDTILFIFKNIE